MMNLNKNDFFFGVLIGMLIIGAAVFIAVMLKESLGAI